jgi:hypothetical protein
MNNQTDHFDDFLISIDEELGRDKDSLYLFEWAIEERYERIITLNTDLFIDRPDLMEIQNEQIVEELDTLLSYFESIEEYEKCGRLLNIMTEFKTVLKKI